MAVLALAFVVTALPLATLSPPALAQTQEETLTTGEEIIVVLNDGDDPFAAAQAMGVEVKHVYKHVFTGFAGTVTNTTATAAAERSRRPPQQIADDGPVRAEAQMVPTGVSRAGTPRQPGAPNLDIPSPVDADIAILDTGIASLADLNVVGGVSCIGSDPNAWQDDNGHGTHVAGISAAKDNDVGVVGVAPGARLWAVKVLNASGGGSFSDVICGLDWVAANANTIDVANLSLSGQGQQQGCSDSPLHTAICAVVNAGVPVVVAAGNQGTDASARVPANYPEVITVSGITDSDGQPGGLGPKPCYSDQDDSFLSFSNFGAAVDITAPGGCIVSYNPSGGLESASGTSEASPHVAGAVAIFVADTLASQGSRPSPDATRNWLLTEASRSQAVDGVTGDPDTGQAQSAAKKKKIKKLKKKIKKSKGKGGKKKKNKNKSKKGKGGKAQAQAQGNQVGAEGKKKLKKKLKAARSQSVSDGNLEPVLWLETLRS
jgi:subtilisin family serine protease